MRFPKIAFASAVLATGALAAPASAANPDARLTPITRRHELSSRAPYAIERRDDYGVSPSPPAYTTSIPTLPDFNTTKPRNGTFACINDEQAAAGADIFRQLIQEYSDEIALDALTEDFVDYSSAVNIIRNRGNPGPFRVDGISFNGRAAFMAAQGSQPQIPFETLNTWHGCDTISTRWRTTRSANGQATESNNIPVIGLAILVVVPDSANSYGFRVKELYSEFNAAAWLVNNGVFTPSPVTTTNFPEATATGAANKRGVLPNVGMI